jgi:hypothetical protein
MHFLHVLQSAASQPDLIRAGKVTFLEQQQVHAGG